MIGQASFDQLRLDRHKDVYGEAVVREVHAKKLEHQLRHGGTRIRALMDTLKHFDTLEARDFQAKQAAGEVVRAITRGWKDMERLYAAARGDVTTEVMAVFIELATQRDVKGGSRPSGRKAHKPKAKPLVRLVEEASA